MHALGLTDVHVSVADQAERAAALERDKEAAAAAAAAAKQAKEDAEKAETYVAGDLEPPAPPICLLPLPFGPCLPLLQSPAPTFRPLSTAHCLLSATRRSPTCVLRSERERAEVAERKKQKEKAAKVNGSSDGWPCYMRVGKGAMKGLGTCIHTPVLGCLPVLLHLVEHGS